MQLEILNQISHHDMRKQKKIIVSLMFLIVFLSISSTIYSQKPFIPLVVGEGKINGNKRVEILSTQYYSNQYGEYDSATPSLSTQIYNENGLIENSFYFPAGSENWRSERYYLYNIRNKDSLEYEYDIKKDDTTFYAITRYININDENEFESLASRYCSQQAFEWREVEFKDENKVLLSRFYCNSDRSTRRDTNVFTKYSGDTLFISSGSLNAYDAVKVFDEFKNLTYWAELLGDSILTEKISFYNRKGLKKEEIVYNISHYRDFKESLAYSWRYRIRYDRRDYPKKVVVYEDDKKIIVIKAEYEYDHKENWIQRSVYYNGDLWSRIVRNIKYIDE